MRCPNCHATINDLEEYCPKCGTLIPIPYCVNCGAPLERGDVFCPKCGAVQGVPIDPEQIEPADAREDDRPQNAQSEEQQYKSDDYGYEDEEDFEDDDGFGDEEDSDDWDDDDEGGVRVAPLIVVVIIAAVVVIVFAAWRFGILDNLFAEREETAVVEEVESEAEDETPHVLNFVTQTLEFNDPGLTSRIYFDTDIEDQSEIEWTSSDTAVATVDGNGYVTSVGAGRAVVTAQWGDLSAACNVACDYTREEETIPDTEEDNPDAEEEEEAEPEETPEDEEEEEVEAVITADGDYLCSFSSDRLITQADMAALSASDYGSLPAGRSLAQMMINEIYARHGYQFETEALQQYFDQKDWYKAIGSYSPDSSVVMNRMNDIEKQNITFLNNY